MIRLAIAPDLVEEAVLLAERQAPPEVAHAFRRERDQVYEIPDPELRETAFHSLALEWFARFGLREALEAIFVQYPALDRLILGGRIVRATRRSAEGADLVDVAARDAAGSRPLLVVRLTPESLLSADTLAAFLRHELMHITDMLNPAFGYERTLPQCDGGPSADNILRDRYRVVWDVTIDGRLAQHGLSETRASRWREFRTAFAMLEDRCAEAFDDWWSCSHPTHRELLAFATAPAGTTSPRRAGRCPVCGFPVASLDARVSTLREQVIRALEAEHPSWRPEHGLCPQCFDLYDVRYRYRSSGAQI